MQDRERRRRHRNRDKAFKPRLQREEEREHEKKGGALDPLARTFVAEYENSLLSQKEEEEEEYDSQIDARELSPSERGGGGEERRRINDIQWPREGAREGPASSFHYQEGGEWGGRGTPFFFSLLAGRTQLNA